jgi:hypothetical protein
MFDAELTCDEWLYCRWLASLLGLIIIGICLMCVSINLGTYMCRVFLIDL